MLKISAARKGNSFVSSSIFMRNDFVRKLLFLLLFFGILLGCVFSVYSPLLTTGRDSFFSVALLEESSFPSAIISTGKYCFLVILSATSYLGVISIPSLVFVRGFALGSAIASFYAIHGYSGFLIALALCGVTELLTLPVMMLLAEHLFYYSKSLLHLRLNNRVIRNYLQYPQQILIFTLILLSLAIVYQCVILPQLHI